MNASQMRLETMVAMASDKALQLQEEIANRSHADRQHVNGELRNQAEKIVNAMQKLSLRLDPSNKQRKQSSKNKSRACS